MNLKVQDVQVDLFGNSTFSKIQTEGIKYAGSKLKLIRYILESIEGLGIKNVLDGFSGTTRVSQAFAKAQYNTAANDISYWSETFAKCFLLAKKENSYYQKLILHLNNVSPVNGWFTEHYGGGIKFSEKRPFQIKNTQKLDGIREEIDTLKLDEIDKSVALTSLILALDKVDSTMGHYVSYLNKWSPRSFNHLHLKVPNIVTSKGNHSVFRGDIFETLENQEFDLCYFDPPYGSNNEKMPPSRVRYASYYHIWTSIIKNDKPQLFGKANRRIDTKDSVSCSIFEEFRKDADGNFIAMKAIERMIRQAKAKYILLSYSSGGRATKKELLDILNCSGKLLKSLEIDYKRNVMASMRWTNEWVKSDNKHKEYLFLIEK